MDTETLYINVLKKCYHWRKQGQCVPCPKGNHYLLRCPLLLKADKVLKEKEHAENKCGNKS